MKSYISPILIRELKEVFPERLPGYADYEKRVIPPETIAFRAGIQHCIRYLEESAAVQNDET